MDDQNQDLAKQYQDILDRYSRELSSSPSEEPPQPEPQPQLQPIPAPAPAPTPAPINIPEAPAVTTEAPPAPVSSSVPPKSNFFKYLFFISLIIFLGVFAVIAYTVYNTGAVFPFTSAVPTPVSDAGDSTPTTVADKVCSVNEKQYKIGESFQTDDGCNSCVCSADLTISCTQKACEATPSTKLIPTLKATPTTNTLGTWKKYSQLLLGFELMYPSTMTKTGESNDQFNKYVSFANSKTNVSVVVKNAPGVDMTKYYYMDSPIDSTSTISAGLANVYKLPNGYCDGPSCSKPAIVYVLKNGDNLFQIIFMGDILMSKEEQQILSTFKFIP